jgi:hypothetical protein
MRISTTKSLVFKAIGLLTVMAMVGLSARAFGASQGHRALPVLSEGLSGILSNLGTSLALVVFLVPLGVSAISLLGLQGRFAPFFLKSSPLRRPRSR